MKIIAAALCPYELPFARPLQSARGECRLRRGTVLVLVDELGHRGLGDACAWPGFGASENALARALTALVQARGELLGPGVPEAPLEIEALCERAASVVQVRAALATALHDLVAQRRQEPLAKVLGAQPSAQIAVGALANDPETARQKTALGHRTLKVKVGAGPWRADVERLRQIRSAVGSEVALRADANQAWTFRDAVDALAACGTLGLEFLEEPLAEPCPETLAALAAEVEVPLALDESLLDPAVCAESDPAWLKVAVLKPMLHGGPWAALARARSFVQQGIGVSLGTLFESAVGRAAAWHVAAALQTPLACGLSSPLRTDVADLAAPVGGHLGQPPGPGLGVRLRERGAS